MRTCAAVAITLTFAACHELEGSALAGHDASGQFVVPIDTAASDTNAGGSNDGATPAADTTPGAGADAGESLDVGPRVGCLSSAECEAIFTDVGRCNQAVCSGSECLVARNPLAAVNSEICNGEDDDCDGKTDAEDPDLAANAPLCAAQLGVCAGARMAAAACVNGSFGACGEAEHLAHSAAFQTVETRCDGADNDCDGLTDQADPSVTAVCCAGPTGCPSSQLCTAGQCVPAAPGACDSADDCAEMEQCAAELGACVGFAGAGEPCVTDSSCAAGLACGSDALCVLLTWCGDGACAAGDGETCSTCGKDCACADGNTCAFGSCCTPSCNGKTCGSDGCGGQCGPGCVDAQVCSGAGKCEALTSCGDGTCDASLNESCLTCKQDCACADGQACTNGACCSPQCQGRSCGSDGCGGECGPGCAAGHYCAPGGQCTALTACGDGACVSADEETCFTCAKDCGCAAGTTCDKGQCCQPNCAGRACGPDGCGGQCGPGCAEGQVCTGIGVCSTLTSCGDGVCDASANESCLTCLTDCGCDSQLVCVNGGCCSPKCEGRDCGTDGCGGECGPGCVDGEYCASGGHCSALTACGDGACTPSDEETCFTCAKDCGCGVGAVCDQGSCCKPNCVGRTCGTDGCGGECGPGCVEAQYCGGTGQCQALSACGDGVCDASAEENCVTCAKDCACNQGTVCHSGVCCVPQCSGRVCGPDLCGGTCGPGCADGSYCGGSGQCSPVTTCGDGTCAPTDEENCVTCKKDCACTANDVCTDGACCTPLCTGKSCGPDGCGGSCGPGCGPGTTCVSGSCAPLTTCGTGGCQPQFGETCASCAPDCACDAGAICVAAGLCCTPSCAGRACGPDGCGGSCGDCKTGEMCTGPGQCAALSTCGVNGCQAGLGENCLTCPGDCGCGSEGVCVGGECRAPDCTGRECGSDGAGGVCGTCAANAFCSTAGKCVCPGQTCGAGLNATCCASGSVCGASGSCCEPSCSDKMCGPNGCGGVCGYCPVGFVCNSSGQCAADTQCGDGFCDASEGCLKCAADCSCGPGEICGAGGAGGRGVCKCLGSTCGGACCLPTEVCAAGSCCHPSCDNKHCGSDGCGGVCGQCFGADTCKAYPNGLQLCCDDTCPVGWSCGTNACGRACGTCKAGSACNPTTHQCDQIKSCGTVGHATCEPEAPWFETCATCSDCACGAGMLCDPSQAPGTVGCVSCDVAHDGILCGGACCPGRASAGAVCNGGSCCQSKCKTFGGTQECGLDACGTNCGGCSGATGIACIGGVCQCPGASCQDDSGGSVCCSSPTDVCFKYGTHPFPVCYSPKCTGAGGAFACGVDPNGYSCGVCAQPAACLRFSDATTFQRCSTLSGTACAMAGADHSACCTPNCAGRQCGSDGCGGTCGTCPSPQKCNPAEGACCLPQCNPADECGDDGCGGTCGAGCSGDTFCILDPVASSYRICKPKSCTTPLQCTLDGADGACLGCADPMSVCADHGAADSCDSVFPGFAWPKWLRDLQNQGRPTAAPATRLWKVGDSMNAGLAVIDDTYLFGLQNDRLMIWNLTKKPMADANGDYTNYLGSQDWRGTLLTRVATEERLILTKCSEVRAYQVCRSATDVWIGPAGVCPATRPGGYESVPAWTTSLPSAGGSCHDQATVGTTYAADGSNTQPAVFFTSSDHKLYAMALTDGHIIWSVTLGGSGSVTSSPAVTPDGDIVAASATGVLYSVRPDGKVRWSTKIGDGVRGDPLVVVTQATAPVRYSIFVVPTVTGLYNSVRVIGFGQDGSRLWTTLAPFLFSGQAIPVLRLTSEGFLAVTDGRVQQGGSVDSWGTLSLIDPTTGTLKSTIPGQRSYGAASYVAPNEFEAWATDYTGALMFLGPGRRYGIESTTLSYLQGDAAGQAIYSPAFPNFIFITTDYRTIRLEPKSCADLGFTQCGVDGAGNSCGTCATGVCYDGRCKVPATGSATCGLDGAGGTLGTGCANARETCGPGGVCSVRVENGAISPVEGGDRFHSGRVATPGPTTAPIPPAYKEFTFHSQGYMTTGISEDGSGNLYVGASNNWFYKLVQKPDGSLDWDWIFKEAAGAFDGQAYVAYDGTVFAGNQDRNVYAMGMNADSKVVTRWRYGVQTAVQGSPVPASLVDPAASGAAPIDGLLVVAGDRLYALDAYTTNPSGKLLWSFRPADYVSILLTPTQGGSVDNLILAPSTDADGTIYLTAGEWIMALRPDGHIKWKFALTGTVRASPIVDPVKKVMYVVPNSYTISGTLPYMYTGYFTIPQQSVVAVDLTRRPEDADFWLWEYAWNPTRAANSRISDAALSADGRHLYVVTRIAYQTAVSSLATAPASKAGLEEWRAPVTGDENAWGGSTHRLFVDSSGAIFFGGLPPSPNSGQSPKLTRISSSGSVEWSRFFCSGCTLFPGDWTLGMSGAVVYPTSSVAIPGSYALRVN